MLIVLLHVLILIYKDKTELRVWGSRGASPVIITMGNHEECDLKQPWKNSSVAVEKVDSNSMEAPFSR